MSDLAAKYTTEIREHMTHLGTWLPNERLALGALGFMKGDRFVRQSNLKKEFGLAIGETEAFPQGNFSHYSQGGVKIELGVGAKGSDPGSTVIKAGTEIDVSFLKQNAILLDLVECTGYRIADQLTLARQILELWEERRWKPEMCTIVELVEAKSTTAIISDGSAGGVKLRATAQASVTDALSLADARLGLQTVSSENIGLQWLSTPDATPLMRALRLKKSLWKRDPKVVIEGLDAIASDEPLAEGEYVSYFDLLGED
jgi:hypothetical protein